MKHISPPHLYELKTKSGSIETTSEHGMLVFSGNMISVKKTRDISKGDLLIVPKNIHIDLKGEKIKYQNIPVKRYYKISPKAHEAILDRIHENHFAYAQIALHSGISVGYMDHIRRNDRNFREDNLKKLTSFLSLHFPTNQFIPQNSIHGNFISLPAESSPALMQIMGYFLGDGYAGKRHIRFKDMRKDVLMVYQMLFGKVFGLQGRIGTMSDTRAYILEINSLSLANWFKANITTIKADLLNKIGILPMDEISSFLRGLFDAEGCVAKNARQICLGMTDEKIINICHQLLLRFGILSSVSSSKRKDKNWKTSYKISISNRDSIEQFLATIGFSSSQKKNEAYMVANQMEYDVSLSSKILPFPKQYLHQRCKSFVPAAKLKSFLGSGRNLNNFITKSTLLSFISYLEKEFRSKKEAQGVIKELSIFLKGEVVFQQIVEKKKIKSSYPLLYDLEVSPNPNFIASGFLSHNSRWATHGGITDNNAHPHFSSDKSFALAQNGIVENYQKIKDQLSKKAYKFQTETDTEVIVRLIEDKLKSNKDLKKAVRAAFLELEGRNTIIILTKDGQIIACRNGSPLVIGVNDKEIFFSSDTLSFAPYVEKVIIIDNGQMVYLEGGKPVVLDIKSNKAIPIKPEKIDFESSKVDKEGYDHFMIKEVSESPYVIRQIINQDLALYKDFTWQIKKAKTVYTIGSGTAGLAASQIGFYLRLYGGIKTQNLIPADVHEYSHLFQKGDLMIAPSQSGETADVLEVLEEVKKKGVKIASYVNMPGSTMSRMSDYPFLATAGPEICVLSTKIFTSQIAWGYLISKILQGKAEQGLKNLKKLAQDIEEYLQKDSNHLALKKLAKILIKSKDIFLMGKYQNLNIVREGMVKIIEGSYIHAQGIPAGDLKHYAITLMQKGVPVIAVMSNDIEKDDVINAVNEVKARGATVIGLSPTAHDRFDFYIPVPDTGETSGIFNIIPLQVLAYYMAISLGHNVDKPRNIAKSVTVK